MTSVEARINLQETRLHLLQTALDPIKKVDLINLTKPKIQTRLDVLESNWAKFDKDHERICEAKPESTKDLPYMRDNHYAIAQEAYMINKAAMLDLLAEIVAANPLDGTTLADTSMIATQSAPRKMLPKIELTKFEGSYKTWRSFSDMFTTLIGADPDLSNVMKMHYLKSSVSGDAANLISNFQVTGENFIPAWDKLVARYENKRVLITKHLDAIFKLKPLQRKSAKGLNNLLSTVNEALGALKALGSPTHKWDQIIVYSLVNRLDPETHEAWEIHEGGSVAPSTLEDLEHFIEGHARALESIEGRETSKTASIPPSSSKSTSNSPKAKAHVAAVEKQESRTKGICSLCNQSHYLAGCQVFAQKSPPQRREFLITKRLCFNCLGPHLLKDCRSQKSCRTCSQRHHTMIHDVAKQSSQSADHPKGSTSSVSSSPSQSDSSSSQNASPSTAKVEATRNHATSMHVHHQLTVLLATAQVKVIGPDGNCLIARALIDQGSEISFISERLVQKLHFKRSSASISLIGVGATQSSRTRGVVFINLSPVFDSDVSCMVTAYVLPKLTSTLPSVEPSTSSWSHIEGLQLADPSFMTPGSIDLILGAEIYSSIILSEVIKGPPLTPIAQSTIFGWMLSGPVSHDSPESTARTHHCSLDFQLDKLLQQFWDQEEVKGFDERVLSPDEEACEQHFVSTHSRTEAGRYVVRLPMKESPETLGDSRFSAIKMLQSLQRRLDADAEYQSLYSAFLREYETLNHMSKVSSKSMEPTPVFYLPHHGVLRSTSATTKLRVVFNGSYRTSSGKSLNDILYAGAKLQIDLPDVLLWFRRFKYVFAADIQKMYRQVLVHQNDWDLQRILWLDHGQLQTYQLRTVTYGLACAPFLALRTLNQLITDQGTQFPSAVPTLTKGRYVDDIFGGANTLTESKQVIKQVDQLCSAGCFKLQKWISNDPDLLSDISPECQAKEASVVIDQSSGVRTLGLLWKPSSDNFQILIATESIKHATKRSVLSRVAQLFDPLGFIAPVIISAKIFMQQLWLLKLRWDDSLPEHLNKQWCEFEHLFQDLSTISVPRFLGPIQSSSVELHGFSDASQFAMSAVIYLRVENSTSTQVNIVCAKTKVAPLKKQTIPRLELIAATLLTRLTGYVRKVLELEAAPLWLWTDSSVVLTWITTHPSKWKDFVRNRVSFIQENQPTARWRFISGKQNPADCASRGITPKALSKHQLWWRGPEWLSLPSNQWPDGVCPPSSDASSEVRSQKSRHVLHSDLEPDLLHRYSDITRLLRITAWCKRFINRLRQIKVADTPSYLTSHDLHLSLLLWVGVNQRTSFPSDLKLLSKKQRVTNSSSLRSLSPFIDKDGLIRVGGRLDQSSLDYDTKHPYILSKHSELSRLVIRDAHLRTLHSGTRNTLATVRQRFWILGGRPTVKKEILHCVICARYRAERAQQLMGQLPPSRLTPSRPFYHSGVDYAGPFIIKTWRGRAAKTYKGYVVVFICSSTSAMHLELVTDYSADAFIAAYKRFTGRRGICATLSSDCGTTLVGADTELKRLFTASSAEVEKLRILLVNDGTQWQFNPPSAPHFGGRWEAGVKSVKYHLKRVVGNTLLTYEEFTTILAQIEAVLNSRPLCQLTDDPDDLSVLTPGHFLTGGPLSTIPEPNLTDVPITRLSRWQLTRQIIENFWAKWSREYLQQQQAIYKWRFPSLTIQVGSIVLIVDERYPPSKWPLAKVIELHPGSDNLTRVVTVKTAATVLKRPITKLCLLPVPVSTSSTDKQEANSLTPSYCSNSIEQCGGVC